jgi:hypothetical protein
LALLPASWRTRPRIHIAVDDALRVRVRQAEPCLAHERNGPLHRQRPFAPDQPAQIVAVDELGDKERDAVLFAGVEGGDDIGVP